MVDHFSRVNQLIQSGNLQGARKLLIEILKSEPKSDAAWVYMARVVDNDEMRVECYQEALKINPNNLVARAALTSLRQSLSEMPFTRPIPAAPTYPPPPFSQAETPVEEPIQPDKTYPRPGGSSGEVPTTPIYRFTQARTAVPVIVRKPLKKRSSGWLYFLLGISIFVLTWVVIGEDLAYLARGVAANANVVELSRDSAQGGREQNCRVDYQFYLNGTYTQGSDRFPCTEWSQLDAARQLQIEYLPENPSRNRYYLHQTQTVPLALGGFGLGGVLLIYGIIQFLAATAEPARG